MRGFATLSVYLCVVAVFGGSMLFIVGSPDGRQLGPFWMAGLVIMIAGVVTPIAATLAARAEGRRDFEADAADFGPNKGWFDGSGIALDYAGRRALLAQPGKRQELPFDELVSWSYVASRQSMVSTGNALGAILTVASTASAMSHNRKSAGFWIDTKHHGRWRLLGLRPASAARWISMLDMASQGRTPLP